MRPLFPLAAALVVAGCMDAGPDELTAAATSPDGRLTARLWCTDLCDVPEAATLTMSTAALKAKRDEYSPGRYRLPAEDEVGRFHSSRSMRLRWRSPSELEVVDVCPYADPKNNDSILTLQRFRGVTFQLTCPSGPE